MTFCQHAHCASNRDESATGVAGEEEILEADPAMLLEMLRTVPDCRGRKGRRYALSFILAVWVVAALAGAMNYREMAAVAASIPQTALCVLGAEWSYFSRRHEYPRRSTIRAVLAVVDADELDRITTEWLLLQARRNQEDDGSFSWVMALDGKVMRGAWTDENSTVTLFSAMLHRQAVTIAQVMVPEDTKETAQVKALTEKSGLREGERVLATLDAAHASRETAKLIAGKQGWDYLITVKTDKKNLYRQAARAVLPALPGPPHDVMTESSRGRTTKWSCWTASAESVNFPHIRQVACIIREAFDRAGEKTSKEVAIKVTSAGPEKETAADLNRHARDHWGIENKSHYVRDTVYGEDRNQTFKGNGPQALASLHNLAIGLLCLKKVKAIRETMQEIHLDRRLALAYMATERNISYLALSSNGPAALPP